MVGAVLVCACDSELCPRCEGTAADPLYVALEETEREREPVATVEADYER